MLVLQCVVGANSSYTSSCLKSLPSLRPKKMPPAKKKSVTFTNSRWRGNSIDRLLHPSKQNHFETASNATL